MKRSIIAILLILVALFVAACGSGTADDSANTAEDAPTVTVFRTPT